MTKVGECLKDFYQRILKTYGEINDSDISDEDFQNAAYFELSVRMHSNNKRLKSEEIKLVDVIDILELSTKEKYILHDGRRFINYIKRPWKMKGNWCEELIKFKTAFELLKSKNFTII